MRVPWIRVHGGLYDKPVVDRLCRALRIGSHEAIGVLVTFWSGVAAFSTNGSIANAPDSQLAKWAKLSGKRGEKFAEWVRAEHQDEEGRVPEWDTYAGELEYQRERNRLNQQNFRDRRRNLLENLRNKSKEIRDSNADRNDDISGTSPTTRRNETKRDETREVQEPEKQGPARQARPPELPDWVLPAAEVWTAKVGAVALPRLQRALAPLVDQTSLEAVIAAIDVYASPDEGPKGARRIEFFAEEFQRWHRIAQTPLVDPVTREPTERMKRVMSA